VIGVEALGRPEGYSPAQDSSVRTRAYELRQKLEKLYSAELPSEAIQIVVPKGAYSSHYVKPSTIALSDSAVDATPRTNPVQTSVGIERPRHAAWACMVVAALVGAAVTFAGTRLLTRNLPGWTRS
jgi:hypothetical protein